MARSHFFDVVANLIITIWAVAILCVGVYALYLGVQYVLPLLMSNWMVVVLFVWLLASGWAWRRLERRSWE